VEGGQVAWIIKLGIPRLAVLITQSINVHRNATKSSASLKDLEWVPAYA
jgi:hypothetical protein